MILSVIISNLPISIIYFISELKSSEDSHFYLHNYRRTELKTNGVNRSPDADGDMLVPISHRFFESIRFFLDPIFHCWGGHFPPFRLLFFLFANLLPNCFRTMLCPLLARLRSGPAHASQFQWTRHHDDGCWISEELRKKRQSRSASSQPIGAAGSSALIIEQSSEWNEWMELSSSPPSQAFVNVLFVLLRSSRLFSHQFRQKPI